MGTEESKAVLRSICYRRSSIHESQPVKEIGLTLIQQPMIKVKFKPQRGELSYRKERRVKIVKIVKIETFRADRAIVIRNYADNYKF